MIRRLAAVAVCLTRRRRRRCRRPARAGTYTVRACHSDGINNSWQTYRSNGYADAYVAVPGRRVINGHAQ